MTNVHSVLHCNHVIRRRRTAKCICWWSTFDRLVQVRGPKDANLPISSILCLQKQCPASSDSKPTATFYTAKMQTASQTYLQHTSDREKPATFVGFHSGAHLSQILNKLSVWSNISVIDLTWKHGSLHNYLNDRWNKHCKTAMLMSTAFGGESEWKIAPGTNLVSAVRMHR